MKQCLRVVLSMVSFVACAAPGPNETFDADVEVTGRVEQGLTCAGTIATSGSAGGGTAQEHVVAIIPRVGATHILDVTTFHTTNGYASYPIVLGSGLTVSGSVGNTAYTSQGISGVTATATANVLVFSGSASGSLTFSGAALANSSNTGVTELRTITTNGTSLIFSGPGGSSAFTLASTCSDVTNAISSVTGVATLSVSSPGLTGNATFYIDNIAVGSSATLSLSYDTQQLTNATHTLGSVTNTGSGFVVGPTINFTTVNDKTGPTVSASVTTPPGNEGNFTFSATATDPNGISKVEFYVNGTLRGTVYTSPYDFVIGSKTLGTGSFTLTARAYDNLSYPNSSLSSGVPFTVKNVVPTVSGLTNTINTPSSGYWKLAMTATDPGTAGQGNSGVAYVRFMFGADTFFYYDDTTAVSPNLYEDFNVDTCLLANGSYTIYGNAYDNAGNVSGLTKAVSVANAQTAEIEPNGTLAQATNRAQAATTIKLSGSISTLADVDYFKITTPTTATITSLELRMLAIVNADYDLEVFNAAGTSLQVANDAGRFEDLLQTVAPNTVYYIKVSPRAGTTGVGAYNIRLSIY